MRIIVTCWQRTPLPIIIVFETCRFEKLPIADLKPETSRQTHTSEKLKCVNVKSLVLESVAKFLFANVVTFC